MNYKAGLVIVASTWALIAVFIGLLSILILAPGWIGITLLLILFTCMIFFLGALQ